MAAQFSNAESASAAAAEQYGVESKPTFLVARLCIVAWLAIAMRVKYILACDLLT